MKKALVVGGSVAIIGALCYWLKRKQDAGKSAASASNPDPTKNTPYAVLPNVNGAYFGG